MRVSRAMLAVGCLVCLSVCAGCIGALKTVFAPQELSDNYATMPGAIAESRWRGHVTPAPALIDGDVETIGETAREIIIRMPEPRAVRRVTTRNSNYEDVILYVGGAGEDEWRFITQVKQNTKDSIFMNVSVVTDRIRLRIGNTLDDRYGTSEPRIVSGTGGLRQTSFQAGTPKAGEIEIYGLRPKRVDEDVLF